jgi:HEAT repeats
MTPTEFEVGVPDEPKARVKEDAAPEARGPELADCPACWKTISLFAPTCPHCGADVGSLTLRSYREKARAALGHPINEVRERAAALLGSIGRPEDAELLRAIAERTDEPFVAAAALRGLALLARRFPGQIRLDLQVFAGEEHPLLVRAAAKELLRNQARRLDS